LQRTGPWAANLFYSKQRSADRRSECHGHTSSDADRDEIALGIVIEKISGICEENAKRKQYAHDQKTSFNVR
jgi:hypothetical protein